MSAGFAPLLRILRLWHPHLPWLAWGLFLSLAALIAGIAVFGLAATALAGTLGLWLRAMVPTRVALRYAERLATHAAMFRALASLRVWFFRGLARGAGGGIGFRRAGDLLARLVADVDALDGLYLRILIPLAGAFLLAPLLALILGNWNAGLALAITALFLLAAMLLPWAAARSSLQAGDRLTETGAALRVAVLDALTGRREVRAFGAEGRMLAQMQAREAALLGAQHALATRIAWAGAGAFLCGQAALLLVLLGGSAAPLLALIAAFITLAAFEAVAALPRAGALAGHASTAAARILDAAETAPPVPEPASPAATPSGFALRFHGVHFAWVPNTPVFTGLTLDIPEGARIALLGPSGAGKSSLAALALKHAAPHLGTITLGGTDIATLPADAVRARIAWLSQSTHLFNDTIRANLRLARPEADDAALWAALEAARMAETVRALPDGLDSWIGEAGNNFSGGQARRLALARALLSPAPILILDEPCAGLDAETEREFFQALNESAQSAIQGRSLILIAHRLTGAERLDRIYRLSAGTAVAAAG